MTSLLADHGIGSGLSCHQRTLLLAQSQTELLFISPMALFLQLFPVRECPSSISNSLAMCKNEIPFPNCPSSA